MTTYSQGNTGYINVFTGQFVTGANSFFLHSFVVEDGSYAVGDEITVVQYASSTILKTITGELYGYTDDGFVVVWVEDDTQNSIFISNTSFPANQSIPVTRTGTYAVCFLAGTLIATPAGNAAVETLREGDLVLTDSGEALPVRWIGRQTVQRLFADPLRSYPICISAGALDDNIPARDLYVSPDHALLVDGLLVQANALVNGVTITRIERPEERFTYFHIELENHALVIAEGVPAETFVDNVTRRSFDNYAEFEALHGREGESIPEIDLPRVKSKRQLPARIDQRLMARARGRAA